MTHSIKLAGLFAALSIAFVGVASIGGAAEKSSAPAGLGYDSSKPIEVNADSFVADLNGENGTYRGHVIVRQGAVRLSANEVQVFAPGGEASRMEASGNVVVASTSGNAVGDRAVYDVKEQVLHLIGNVVLTKDQNVLRGEALDFDMATGKAQLGGGKAQANQTTAPNGRVQGVFMPQGAGKGKSLSNKGNP
jgi:lipopolysaccharide export system protein LptA